MTEGGTHLSDGQACLALFPGSTNKVALVAHSAQPSVTNCVLVTKNVATESRKGLPSEPIRGQSLGEAERWLSCCSSITIRWTPLTSIPAD